MIVTALTCDLGSVKLAAGFNYADTALEADCIITQRMHRFYLSILLFGFCFLKTEILFAATDNATGQQLFDRHCSVCHSMEPPPKTAPPVLGIALHYREAFGDKTLATEYMVKFMQKPDSPLSKLEPAAIRRFGLMPPMSMSLQELKKVAAWLWDSYDPQFKTPGKL